MCCEFTDHEINVQEGKKEVPDDRIFTAVSDQKRKPSDIPDDNILRFSVGLCDKAMLPEIGYF